MSNVLHQQYYSQSSTTPPSTHLQPHFADNTQLDSGLSPTDNLIENLTNTLALLTQSYKTYLPQTNNQLRTSSNTRNQATVQDGRVVVQNVQGRQNRGQGNNARGTGAAGYGGAQNRVGNANPGGQDNAVDEDVDEQPVQDLALNVDNVFQADDYDAFDSDVDECIRKKILIDMHEQSAQYVSVTTQNNVVDKSLTAKLATYKEQVKLYERRAKFELTEREQKIDEQLRIVIADRNFKEENLKKGTSFYKNATYLYH
ncbi:hypothetical protein Tco_0780950 [Tanacetum coccineum]